MPGRRPREVVHTTKVRASTDNFRSKFRPCGKPKSVNQDFRIWRKQLPDLPMSAPMARCVGHAACVSDACDHEAIVTAARSRRSAQRSRAIHDAYVDPHADELLAQMLDESDDLVFAKPFIAAHLGDLAGAHGDAALRRAIRVSGNGSTDVRCASLLALAKRTGARATPDLIEGLTVPNADVKDYSVIGLAGAGDDQAWEQVLGYLRSVLRRKRRAHGRSQVAYALAYLARHVSDRSRRSELVAFVRGHWDAIDEAEWFARLWPDAAPQGPHPDAVQAPSGEAVQAWARESLFTPMGVPSA
jgi:hypothetical protein